MRYDAIGYAHSHHFYFIQKCVFFKQFQNRRPKTSGEIAEHFPTAWATVSRHLGALRDAGLILSERNGQQVVYELNTTVFQDLVDHLLDWVRPSKKGRARGSGGKHA